MILVSVFAELYNTMKALKKLQEMAYYETTVKVRRVENGQEQYFDINSDDLVPGDVFVVPEKKLP